MDTDRIRRLENENSRLRDRVVELEAELKFERANADARASALRRQVRVLESQRNNIVSHMLTVR
jgi:predicted  nucleic acid-binding Zn-ribbon protein